MKENNDSDQIKDAFAPNSSKRKCIIAQWLVALVLGLFNMNLGLSFSIPTVVIGGLLDENEPFKINSFEASWFGSIPFIVISIGSVFAGFVQDMIGRRGTMIFALIPAIIGWALLYYSNSIAILYTSAAVMGLSAGFTQAPFLSYSGEVFQPELRGTLSSVGGIFFNMGYIIAFLLGAIYKWRTAVGVCSFWPLITFFLLLLIPESPVWLAQKGKMKKAKASLCWLRGWTSDYCINNEWNTIIHHILTKSNQGLHLLLSEGQEASQNEAEIKARSGSHNSLKKFFSPPVQKPLLLINIYFFGSFCSCLIPTKPMLLTILMEMKVDFDPYWFMVISSVIQFIGAISFTMVLKRFGKRLITTFDFTFAILTCYGLGLYVLLDCNITWIALTLFALNSFIATFGLTTIPWILISEIFPLEFRGVASGVSTALCNVMVFLTTKTFINAQLMLGMAGSFILYGTIGLFGLIYLYINLPETEGKTLHEIETSFRPKEKSPIEVSGNTLI